MTILIGNCLSIRLLTFKVQKILKSYSIKIGTSRSLGCLMKTEKQKKNRIILTQKYAPVIESEQDKLKLFRKIKKTILKLLKKLKKSKLKQSMNK